MAEFIALFLVLLSVREERGSALQVLGLISQPVATGWTGSWLVGTPVLLLLLSW